MADLVLGKVDAFELTAAHTSQGRMSAAESDWFTLLDAGLKIPLVGSSGARSNGQLLGWPRTYCRWDRVSRSPIATGSKLCVLGGPS